MKRIGLAVLAATLVASGAAYAAGGVPFTYKGEMKPEIRAIFSDDNGMVRDKDDFMKHVDSATPEERAEVRQMCTTMQEQKATFSDHVKTNCDQLGA